MKKLNQVLYVSEFSESGKWYVSFLKPEFQGGESVEVSKEDALRILNILGQ